MKRQDAEPKPFFWIPLEGESAPVTETPPFHDRFDGLSGQMALAIQVQSEYLYVGSGAFDFFPLQGQEQACYTFASRNGQLIIPGTGIKGAVRSVVEALSNSCVSQTARKDRLQSKNHTGCRGIKQGQERRTRLCPACRLFGTTGYRGRVHFADALPLGDVQTTHIKIADLWPPRQIKGRKFYQTKAFQQLDMRPEKSHRFLEVVPRGAQFETTLFLENLSPAEMGVLLRALGLGPHSQKEDSVVYAFPIKLGGAKPRCLGSVQFRPTSVFLVDGTDLLGTLPEGKQPDSLVLQMRRWLDDATLLDKQAWERFLKEAKPQQDACPREVY